MYSMFMSLGGRWFVSIYIFVVYIYFMVGGMNRYVVYFYKWYVC